MKSVALNELVLASSPICYGILMPGQDTEGGIPVVKVRDYDHRGIDVEALLRVSPEIEAPYRRSRLEPGDILMSIRGTTGVVAIVPSELKGANITQDTARIRVDGADVSYVYQALQAPSVRRQIRLNTIGQAVRGINIGALRQLHIPWPEASKRTAIGQALDRADDVIRLIRRIHNHKLRLKRGLAQQLLTSKTRFSEFEDNGWENVPLGKFFKEKTNINTDRKETLVYSCTKSVGIVPQAERFSKRLASDDLVRYKVVESGDLVYDPMLLWDGSIGFVPKGGRGVVSPAYETFTATEEANQDYFWVLLKSYNLLHRYKRISKGTNTRRKKALSSDFLKIAVPMPSTKKEQNRIAEVLRSVQQEIELLKKQLELFEQYKRGLLSHLLSGQVPVGV